MKESQNTEWKESWRDEYLRWICGFANAEGGVLVIGRNDKGMVRGLSRAAKLLVDIPNKVRDILGIVVEVNLREQAGKEYLEIVVEPYPYPVSYKGEYHYRSGSTNQTLKGAALQRFLLGKQGLHWDGVPAPGLQLAACGKEAFEIFRRNAARSGRVDEAALQERDEVLLEHLQLVEGDYLKRPTALLFAKEPEKFVSGAYTKIGFFRTDDDLLYQDEIHGSLFVQVENILELLRTKYLKAYIRYEGIQRIEEYLFPIPALREAILNALVHKDYASAIPIQISVYEHQIVIWSPGHLPDDWTMEKLLGKHPSRPFNPLVANAFFRAGYVEAWGRGIEKIQRECREYDIPPPDFDPDLAGLMLTFHANPSRLTEVLGDGSRLDEKWGEKWGDKWGEKWGETMAAKRLRIARAMLRNPRVSTPQLAAELGMGITGIENHLKVMRESGCIRRVGPPRGGHWEILP